MHKGFATTLLCFWVTAISVLLYELITFTSTNNLELFETLRVLTLTLQQKFILGHGLLTPLLFILAFLLRPLFFFPASIMTMTTVILLGPVEGFLVSYTGEMASSSLTYYIGKYFGEELGLTKKVQMSSIGKYFKGNTFISIFILRIVPLFPFDFINYSSGIFKISFKKYTLATLLGLSPGLLTFIFLTNSLTHRELLPIAITTSITLILIGLLIKKRYTIKELL